MHWFIIILFNNGVISVHNMVSNYWIGKYMEGSGCGLTWVTVSSLSWRDYGRIRALTNAGLCAEIWTQNFPIMNQDGSSNRHCPRPSTVTKDWPWILDIPQSAQDNFVVLLRCERLLVLFNPLKTVRVRVILRLAIYRQLVRLGTKSLETHDQYFLLFNWTLAVIVLM
jgi:hypothetical protein